MSFQLALTTECIRQIFRFSNCFNSFNSHSLRSVSCKQQLYVMTVKTFNSHPLRSVSSHKGICSYVRYLSTRTRYGVYPPLSNIFILAHNLSTRTHYGVYLDEGIDRELTQTFQLALTTECTFMR